MPAVPDALLDWLRAASEAMPHPNAYAYVLEHGEPFAAAPLPRPYPYRRFRAPRACFRNAGRLAMEHEELTYVEGYACDPSHGATIKHAWCVDPDKRVVDPTWRDASDRGVVYLAVRFPNEQVGTMLDASNWGSVIDAAIGC
jgi:hypothetical protein